MTRTEHRSPRQKEVDDVVLLPTESGLEWTLCTVERKPIFLRVPFYGDKIAHFLRRSFSNLISPKFFAAKPILLFTPFQDKGVYKLIFRLGSVLK